MRKTNLFYLTDNTSNFLTFSNYGEYLTGVCLSTNHKIYPSSFIAFNLPFDNNHSIEEFKKFLMCYYENKLAYLRDYYESNDKNQEELSELSYLIEAICLFFETKNINSVYYGDITEHDYNGTYNDSICIVDLNRYKTLDITITDDTFNVNNKKNTEKPLYGWENESSLDILSNYKTIADSYSNNTYSYNPHISNSFENTFCTFTLNNDQLSDNQLTFNCIIPLFDIVNVSIEENVSNIDESNFNIEKYLHIPYGIWLIENPITLYRRSDNIAQSWSLVISSKFAPYPYGVKINDTYDELDKMVENYTYAELLSKQSELLERYNKAINIINNLSSEINGANGLKTKIQNLEQLYSSNGVPNGLIILDKVEEKLKEFDDTINEKLNKMETLIKEYADQFKWTAISKA